MTFMVTKEEVNQCLLFAKEAWKHYNQSRKDFGVIERKEKEFIADQTEGKLAEIVVKKFLSNKGITAILDFNNYEGILNTDKGDFKILQNNRLLEPKIDIKGSSSLARWLFVEDYKFLNRNSNEFVSNAFIMVGFGKDFPNNKKLRENPEILLQTNITGEMIGWAKSEDFLIDTTENEFWFTWKRGSYPWKPFILPPTRPLNKDILNSYISNKISEFRINNKPTTISVPLKASTNYALPTNWLRNDWEELINLLTERDLPTYKKMNIEDLDFSLLHLNSSKKVVAEPVYSILLYIRSNELNQEMKNILVNSLYSGIKIILLTDTESILDSLLKDKINEFKEASLLQIHKAKIELSSESFSIIDGMNCENSLEKYSAIFDTFNYEQYRIEHAEASQHLMVKAGAGTGKTSVMVERVLCLMQRDSVKPAEIAMITFTRDSSKEMYSRLRNKLFLRYSITQKVHYLKYIEDLKKMNISTIHSFAKKILKETGSYLGYGRDVQIRSFSYNRKRIIENAIEQYFIDHQIELSKATEILEPFQLYEIVDIVNRFWEELEKKGLSQEEFSSLQWGEYFARNKGKYLNDIFKHIFPKIEYEFQIYKQQNNSVSLNDLTRQVDLVLRATKDNENPLNQLSMNIKYLFIDEFQDSDDVQIRLIKQIQKALGIRIFAVGDVKQSIYRFRGADHTAFERLKTELEELNQNTVEMSLQKNYRTVDSILRKIHLHFKHWEREGWLTYGNNDELLGVRKLPKGLPNSPIVYKETDLPKEELENVVVEMINTALSNINLDIESAPNKRSIAALVRTNKEARLLEAWSKRNNIETYLNIGGTFFISDAVKDFYALIEALLFPNNSVSLVNLYSTPYSASNVHWIELSKFNGDERKICNHLKNKPLVNEDENNYKSNNVVNNKYLNLEDCILQVRIAPLFSVLRNIIKLTQVENRYLELKIKHLESQTSLNKENKVQQAKTMQKQYILNLNHLMDLLHTEFKADFVTLNQIYNWLKLNQAVNRSEDEPVVKDIPNNVLNIITVHKSKGLEYHTVLVPFTEKKFRNNFNEILLDKSKNQVGWQIKKNIIQPSNQNSNFKFNNSFYNFLDQEEELSSIQEEVRLLYVALTRTENQLLILNNTYEKYPSSSINTWGKILASSTGGIK